MPNEPTLEEKSQRLASLRAEFEKLLEFHEKSFSDIDAKAKYWLTLTLPSFVALMGFLFQDKIEKPLALQMASWALATCLFVSTILFSTVLASRPVESGILLPQSRRIKDIDWFMQSGERWAELGEDQASEMLKSISNNEAQNAAKSKRLRLGEVSLLRSAPTAICLAGGAAFLYSASCPCGFSAIAGIGAGGSITSVGAVPGIGVGALTTAFLLFVDHLYSRKK